MHALVVAAAIFAAGAIVTAVGVRLIERAHLPRGRFVDVDGLRQHVVELGPPSGMPIVLLHGAGCNLEDLRLALGERLAARHRVVLVDRPGAGWSRRRGRADSAPSRQAAILRGVLESLGVGRAIVVGHSWGGALASAFALYHPQCVAGLVLLAPPLYPLRRSMTLLYAVLATPFAGCLLARTLALPFGLLTLRAGIGGAFLPQWPPRDYLRRAAMLLLLRPSSFLANAQDVADLAGNLVPQGSRYGALTAPTVVLTGNSDLVVTPGQHAMRFARAVPNAKLLVLPGIGHMLHHVAGDRVIAAIEEIASAAAR